MFIPESRVCTSIVHSRAFALPRFLHPYGIRKWTAHTRKHFLSPGLRLLRVISAKKIQLAKMAKFTLILFQFEEVYYLY